MKNYLSADRRTILVTGATSGIGLATAKALAGMGTFVIGSGRSAERCRKAEESIRRDYPDSRVEYFTADLSSQTQIRNLAREIRSCLQKNHDEPVLDTLINNAGVYYSRYTETEDGIETTFAINHLAPFLLTHELFPLLAASADGRVVTVGSGSHFYATMKWKDLQLRRFYFGLNAYKQSKLGNILFTAEFNRRFQQKTGVRAFVADPGLVQTPIAMKQSGFFVKWFWKHHVKKGVLPEEGAKTSVFLATASKALKQDAIYWKHEKPLAPNSRGLDESDALRLWDISCRLCQIESWD
ncbi:MAG: SDR family NAD(P)-dependent oxidoreductase [Candidatus Marinimicrobia bacterium]|nr:SDR family NAD(P)-dependent oxidoreductase [Candidatus Neomarinimicrobiota bacterium]